MPDQKSSTSRGKAAIVRLLVALLFLVPLFAACSGSNNAPDASAAQRNCVVALEPAFKVERGPMLAQLSAIVQRSRTNIQDPSVLADLTLLSAQVDQVDQSIQGTTCASGGFEYLRTVQGASTAMKRAVVAYSQALNTKDVAQLQLASQQFNDLTARLKHAADLTSQGAKP